MTMPREFSACALWAISLSMMVFGTADSIRDNHASPWLAWGIFLAVAACVPTGWALLHREVEASSDPTVSQIVTTVDALHHTRHDADVPHIGR